MSCQKIAGLLINYVGTDGVGEYYLTSCRSLFCNYFLFMLQLYADVCDKSSEKHVIAVLSSELVICVFCFILCCVPTMRCVRENTLLVSTQFFRYTLIFQLQSYG